MPYFEGASISGMSGCTFNDVANDQTINNNPTNNNYTNSHNSKKKAQTNSHNDSSNKISARGNQMAALAESQIPALGYNNSFYPTNTSKPNTTRSDVMKPSVPRLAIKGKTFNPFKLKKKETKVPAMVRYY